MKHLTSPGTWVVILLAISSLALWWWDEPLRWATAFNTEQGLLLGYVAFVALQVAAVVLAPFAVMPLVPIASQLFGPFVTGCLSVVGWSTGSVIAFLLARRYGRPLIVRFVDMRAVDRLVDGLPDRAQFWMILCLRHLLPVDVLSYALGLVAGVSFRVYTLASVLGVVWFSFVFAYAGEAFFQGDLFLLLELALASLFVFSAAWYIVRRKRRDRAT